MNFSVVFNSSIESTSESVDDQNWWMSLIIAMVCVSILLANSLVIAMFSTRRTLHTPSRSMYLSLAYADVLVGVISACNVAPAYLGRWVYSRGLCLVTGVMMTVSVSVSFWSLAMLSVDRYVAICHALRYHSIMTPAKITTACIAVWGLAFIFFGVPALYPNTYFYQPGIGCMLDANQFPLFAIILFTSVMPGTMIIFCYYKIWRAVKNLIVPAGVPEAEIHAQNQKALRTVIFVAGAFFLCWAPSMMLGTINAQIVRLPSELMFIATWVGIGNSFVNAIVYSLTNKDFRDVS